MLGDLQTFSYLPEWLSAIADPDLVADAIRMSPAFALSTLTLKAVQITRVRFKKKRWSGLYRLTVTDKATPGHPDPTIRGGPRRGRAK